MKLILITLVAVVVGMMVSCGGGDSRVTESKPLPAAPAAPVAPPPPAYSDAEVIGAVKGHLIAVGMHNVCQNYGKYHLVERATVRRDPSNPDKYFVTATNGGSWTFIGSLAKVISTSTRDFSALGC